MPRKPRYYIPDVPVHLVQRGRNRDPVFFDDEDYLVYLERLGEASDDHACAIHAYVLMTNHIHILLTPQDAQGPGRLMQHVGRHYVPYINHKYGMSGSIWEGRYKASLVDAENYLLTCMRYIELNPVRADMVKHPRLYRWSSYRCNAEGNKNTLIQFYSVYQDLGSTPDTRKMAYRELFKPHMDNITQRDIQSSWQTGTPLGDNRFKARIEKILGQKVGQDRRGRPTGFRMRRDENKTDGQIILKDI